MIDRGESYVVIIACHGGTTIRSPLVVRLRDWHPDKNPDKVEAAMSGVFWSAPSLEKNQSTYISSMAISGT